MEDFGTFRHLSLGQYVATGSVVHNLDPRVKLLGAMALLVAVTATTSMSALLIALLFFLGLMVLAALPLGYVLRGIKPVWPFMLILVVLQLFAFPGSAGADCEILWEWRFLHLTTCSLNLALLSLLRLLGLLFIIVLLTLTTSLNSVVHGTEHLLRPLRRFGLPAHELALVVALALRFVPLLGEETERLMKAQAARGADFGRGRWGFIQRIRKTFPLFIPLFVTSLERAETMALAMEARGYVSGRERSHWVQLRSRTGDYVALALVILLSLTIVALSWL